jgi:hypothetical protein
MRISSSVYFGIAVITIAVCAFAHYAIKKYKREFTLAFFQEEYAESTNSYMMRSDAIKSLRRSHVELGGEAVEGGEDSEARVASAEEGRPKEEGKEEDEHNIGIGESFVFDAQEENETPSRSKMFHLFSVFYDGTLVYREAFRCAWLPITAQFFNFLITLSLFPGVSK